jgi:hypothetical protein
MPPKSFTMQIPCLAICHQITLESKGHKPSSPWLRSTSTYGLVTTKCARPDEYNVWLMPEASTSFPIMVEDHVMSPEWMAQLGHLAFPFHE